MAHVVEQVVRDAVAAGQATDFSRGEDVVELAGHDQDRDVVSADLAVTWLVEEHVGEDDPGLVFHRAAVLSCLAHGDAVMEQVVVAALVRAHELAHVERQVDVPERLGVVLEETEGRAPGTMRSRTSHDDQASHLVRVSLSVVLNDVGAHGVTHEDDGFTDFVDGCVDVDEVLLEADPAERGLVQVALAMAPQGHGVGAGLDGLLELGPVASSVTDTMDEQDRGGFEVGALVGDDFQSGLAGVGDREEEGDEKSEEHGASPM